MSKIPIEQTKYYCMRPDKVNEILSQYKNTPVIEYIKELWNLIDYQKKINEKDKKEVIAMKHKLSWSLYDNTTSDHKITRDGPNFSC
jgi:hypothetical protein